VVIGFDALEQPEVSRIRPLPVSVAEKCGPRGPVALSRRVAQWAKHWPRMV